MVERPVAPRARASTATRRRSTRLRARDRPAARRRPRPHRARPRHRRARRHRLGRRDPHRDRGAREPVARRADRDGGEPALRRPRDDGDARLRPPHRLAELDLHPPERRRRAGRAQGLRHGRQGRSSTGSASDAIRHDAIDAPCHRLQREDPEQRQPRRRQHAAARARAVAAELPRLVARHGPERLPGVRRLPAHRGQRRRRGLGALRLREDARLPLGHLPRRRATRTARSASATHMGEPAWQEVPGEYRPTLRRIIVTQGDTEPASVEQQRHARAHRARRSTTCATCSRSTSRKAATCGRWSTCCTRYFGRDGREEAEELLERRSRRRRQAAHPRRVQRADARLARVLHVHELHRPRRQVPAAARSPRAAFDPLARTRRFMLTEEAHHMFVGETGVVARGPAHAAR